MQFFRTLVVLALFGGAIASPALVSRAPTTCSAGPVQCCNSVQPASSAEASKALGLIGLVLSGLDVPVGLDCDPISVIGAGSSANCNSEPVCCDEIHQNGLLNIGCLPLNAQL
ncbi:fungal hydrophobin [Phanerochaete sordida]|uniref:Hydrophobin n=1 Tax=Phanerochaete sordida TaxID=48140 RepID=A0A9P3LFU3_9APHY|nr:fungal hydrophobin [Phanerochaete sordida]